GLCGIEPRRNQRLQNLRLRELSNLPGHPASILNGHLPEGRSILDRFVSDDAEARSRLPVCVEFDWSREFPIHVVRCFVSAKEQSGAFAHSSAQVAKIILTASLLAVVN